MSKEKSIDILIKELLRIQSELDTNPNPRFIGKLGPLSTVEYYECFPRLDGLYDYNHLAFLKDIGAEHLLLFKYEGFKLATGAADILLSASDFPKKFKAYSEFVEIAESLADARYFKDIQGKGYFVDEITEQIFGLSLDKTSNQDGKESFILEFIHNNRKNNRKVCPIPILNNWPEYDAASDLEVFVMERLYRELKPWADRMLILPGKQKG